MLGNAFREVALLGGVTRIPQLGRVVAGWNFVQGTQRMLCAPGTPLERLGYAAETVVLLVTLKGGTGTVSLPTGGAMRSWANGGAALLAQAASVVTVRVNTQALAGTLAAVDSNGGMIVLLAEGNGSPSASSPIKEFDVVPYKTKAPGFEKHHGVMDVWAQANISKYSKADAPAVVLTPAHHQLTRNWFSNWRKTRTGTITGAVDWKTMSATEAQDMTYEMFRAANVPDDVIREYFQAFHRYIYGLQ